MEEVKQFKFEGKLKITYNWYETRFHVWYGFSRLFLIKRSRDYYFSNPVLALGDEEKRSPFDVLFTVKNSKWT